MGCSSSTTEKECRASVDRAGSPGLSLTIQRPWHHMVQNCPQSSFLILFHLHTVHLLFLPTKLAVLLHPRQHLQLERLSLSVELVN